MLLYIGSAPSHTPMLDRLCYLYSDNYNCINMRLFCEANLEHLKVINIKALDLY